MFWALIAAINCGGLMIAIINFLTIRKPLNSHINDSKVAVILPVRNEAHNIEAITSDLLSQSGLPHLQIVIVDDHSTDGTSQFLAQISDSRATIVLADELQPRWLGKPSALHTGFKALSPNTEIVITLDADVRLTSDALVRAVNALRGQDFISIYPRQLAETFPERLIQPLLPWSWMSSVLVRLAERFPHPSTAIANGQCMVYRYSSLSRLNGFTSIAHEVLDDIVLAKNLLAAGFKGHVVQGAEIVQTRMYSAWSEIKSGYGKSLYPTFHVFGSIALALFLFCTSISPFISLLWLNPFGCIAAIAILGTRALSALSSGNRLRDCLLHPVSISAFIILLVHSYKSRNSVQWKGRSL